MLISELETPAVVIDLDVVDRNLARMADYCREYKLLLRPHTKSHKIPELAQRQIASGAAGITVAKLGEAEVMLKAGITDMLIAYPIVGEEKTTRLARIAEQAKITVSLDSEEAARGISAAATRQGSTIGVLVEMDVGFGRCGLGNENDLLALARTITELPALEVKGLMFLPGHFTVGPEQRAVVRSGVNGFLDRSLETFARAELPLSIVSGGSTPTAYESSFFHGVKEVRPGMYIFNDRTTAGIQAASLNDCALSVVVTVVSTAVSGHGIVGGGSKNSSSDRYQADDGVGFGLVKEDHAAVVEKLSEEHGHLNVARSDRRYRVGERLSIITNQVRTTLHMHNEVYGVRGEQVETSWRVAGRGKVR